MNIVECTVKGCCNQVFSLQLCRKHYEQARLEKAGPCSILGCEHKISRGNLCDYHYRNKLKSLRPNCIIPNCGQKQHNVTTGLCQTHQFRLSKHGKTDNPRGADWGARESHSLYKTWIWHKTRTPKGMDKEWAESFWKFVADVGDKPAKSTLRRPKSNAPLGPANWMWQEIIESKDKAEYSREWRKRNPERAKNIDLKKTYGITLAQYEQMLEQQNNVCAICKLPEMSLSSDGGPRMMPVDHCHTTGKVRGLLCTACNRALGLFKENKTTLGRAIKYLEAHTGSKCL